MRSSLPPVCRYYVFIGVGLTALALSFFAISCASDRKQPTAAVPAVSRAAETEEHPPTTSIEARILEEYQHWKGTRHQLGGSGTDGIDCSGFVSAVYRDAFNIKLPRTTKAQLRQGKPVALW